MIKQFIINVLNASKLPFSSAIRPGDCIFVLGQEKKNRCLEKQQS
jgi:hypothetical protein